MSLVLGWDYGTKKIGVAVGQTITRQARPLEILPPVSLLFWEKCDRLIQRFRPQHLVIGLPLDREQKPYPLTYEVQAWGEALHQRYALPIHYVLEHLTSKEARAYSKEADALVDAIAAAIILEEWLANLPPPSPSR